MAAAHDAFSIAAITAVDVAGNPTAYGSLLTVSQGWGGNANAFGDQNYRLFRYSNGNDLTTTTASNETNLQGIGGILISTSDLGLANGASFFGYSIMGADVTNPLNPTTFPTNTGGGANNTGGIDLVAINGLEIQAVPEPTTLALAILLGLPLATAAIRRARS